MKYLSSTGFLLIIILIIYSCTFTEKDHAEREAVRNYLKEKEVTQFKEIEWGSVDSIYSPFNTQISLEYFANKASGLISYYESEIRNMQSYGNQYKKEIRLYKDSIAMIRSELREMEKDAISLYSKAKKNRLGIKLHLNYKSNSGQNKDATYIFVFNNDKSSIGHHLDIFGNLCK